MRHLSLRNLNRVLSICILVLTIFVGYKLFGPINPATLRR